MPYCTLIDLQQTEPASQLIQLTDDTGTGLVDSAKINAAIASADAVVDTYLRGRVTMPSTVPQIIVMLSRELAIYNLYLRRFGANIPESIDKRRKDAEGKLAQIASGVIQISESQQSEQARAHAVIRTNDREFSNSRLTEY
jgi:phage gp36-like protein